MSKEHAKPGDTIEIPILDGKRFLVIPASKNTQRIPHDGDAWVIDIKEYPVFVPLGYYKIVERACGQDTKNSVDASLQRQMNDNLYSIFG